MSSQGESSGKAAKRAEKQRRAIEAALRNIANVGIHISDRGSDQLARNSQDAAPLQNNERLLTDETRKDKEKGKEKKTRGPTKCKYLEFQSNIEVEFNDKGQPIGANSKKLSSYAGAMAREMVSILYDDWRKVPMETKMFIWESIQQKFKLDDGEHKAYTLQMVGKLWRAYKSRLRRKLSKCKRKDLKKFKPSGSEQVEWDIFQKRRLSKDFTDQQSREYEKMTQQKTFTPESNESVRNDQVVQKSTFGSQCQGVARNNQKVQNNLSPKEVQQDEIHKWKEGRKCLLYNWMNPTEIVAKGRWTSNDPDMLVHFKRLGNNASKVWVDKSLNGSALLWRQNSEMKTIKDVIDTPIAWPTDYIIMMNENDDFMEDGDIDEDEGFEY